MTITNFFQAKTKQKSNMSRAKEIITHKLNETAWIDQCKLPDDLKIVFEEVWSFKPEEFEQVKMYGKMMTCPRWTRSFGKSYAYSGIRHEAEPIPKTLQPIFDWANSLNVGVFHQMLINFYIGPSHGISAHSDAEKDLIENAPIVSVSLGAERTFRIRQKSDKSVIKDLQMPNRSYLIMKGTMQKDFTHEVPKMLSKKLPQIDKRINITFRQIS